MQRIRAAFVQMAPVWGQKRTNLERAARLIASARADLFVLPELFSTGYQLTAAEARELAEPFPGGPTCDALTRIASDADAFLAAGVAERGADGRIYNSSVLVGPRGHVSTYRKTHLFNDEKDAFAPGDSGFSVHDVRGCRVGMMVCFDWAFPEAARSLALLGADVIAHPSNLVLPWGQQVMPIRCLENGVYAVTANRIGVEERREKPLIFTGGSLICGPRAEILAQGPQDDQAVMVAELDMTRSRDKRVTPKNDLLADRVPSRYATIPAGAPSGWVFPDVPSAERDLRGRHS